MRRSLLALLLLLSMLLTMLAGCAGAATDETAESTTETQAEEVVITPVDDEYRNWYEVFVYSYADSDGDKIGDFNGLADKLEYIYDMGFNGIWLMPIMPSPSYHKYDVTDYYDVDPQYGTMEDFRALLEKAHSMGIWVIIDFPVNHTSSAHPWFLDAMTGEDAAYRDYYVWSDTSKSGYSPAGDSYYESRFVNTMPDLNLDNEAVRAEIADIMAFWLQDVGVDGFRLDAVTSYYTGSIESCVEFTSWLGDTAESLKPGCYIVGEAWTNLNEIGQYSEASIESMFLFSVSQQEGSIAKMLTPTAKDAGKTYGEVTLRIEEVLAEHSIPAGFLGNHDTSRPANFIGRSNLGRLKMAGGLLAMLPGNPFVYYGEEIGMTGKGDDPNKRIGMLWTTEEETTQDPPGTTESGYYFPSVAEQQADEDSLLNYYKAAMWLRHANPEIARGDSEVIPCENTDLCIIKRTWEGSSVYIVINPSQNAHSLSIEGTLSGTLSATGEEIGWNADGTLQLPSYSIAILR